MESGIMKVVFSSISNGNHGDLRANEAHNSETRVNGFKPIIKYARLKAEQDAYEDQTSRDVFTSMVNASNCANLQDEKVLDEYLTFAPENAFNRRHQ